MDSDFGWMRRALSRGRGRLVTGGRTLRSTMIRVDFRTIAIVTCALLLVACASLNLADAVQAPRVSDVSDRDATLRILAPSTDHPAGGAAVRMWSRIENPNAFSINVTRLTGDLFVGDGGGVGVDFPLGVPLVANGDTIVPLDVTLGFDALPALGRTLVAAALEGSVPYRLDATIGVDAGMLGSPVFGPLTLLSGSLDIRP